MRAGKIYLPDQAVRIKGEITDRGKVIQFKILIPRKLNLRLGTAHFFILHLQLDPVNLKFMDEPHRLFRVPGWMRGGRLRPQQLFYLPAQLGRG